MELAFFIGGITVIYADGQDLFLRRILCLYCEGEQP